MHSRVCWSSTPFETCSRRGIIVKRVEPLARQWQYEDQILGTESGRGLPFRQTSFRSGSSHIVERWGSLQT
jgi:hypothetical protein